MNDTPKTPKIECNSQPLTVQKVRRQNLSQSFNLGLQTLDEATVSARRMVESLERKGVLQRANTVC